MTRKWFSYERSIRVAEFINNVIRFTFLFLHIGCRSFGAFFIVRIGYRGITLPIACVLGVSWHLSGSEGALFRLGTEFARNMVKGESSEETEIPLYLEE